MNKDMEPNLDLFTAVHNALIQIDNMTEEEFIAELVKAGYVLDSEKI